MRQSTGTDADGLRPAVRAEGTMRGFEIQVVGLIELDSDVLLHKRDSKLSPPKTRNTNLIEAAKGDVGVNRVRSPRIICPRYPPKCWHAEPLSNADS
ncbi:hypothetical protein EVAR_47901_1 [Eumeta japonica]|uniref:Uncharacterized protein n=1 Tax=Eumeta variegata TaxID=151549 RepID=A0A4C1YC88_EUMVA|nr:hypothetical protein EVAR_47901_1 [Eumeta japonica]